MTSQSAAERGGQSHGKQGACLGRGELHNQVGVSHTKQLRPGAADGVIALHRSLFARNCFTRKYSACCWAGIEGGWSVKCHSAAAPFMCVPHSLITDGPSVPGQSC